MLAWLWMALASGILLGFYDIFKKKATTKNSVVNILALYSLFCFIIVSFEIKNALNIDYQSLILIFIKSLIIFFCWILGLSAIKNMPISIITPFSTLSPLFSIILGILVLKERLGYIQVMGVVIIFTAYYLIGKTGKDEITGIFKNKYFYLMVGSSLLNAVSALIDKIALRQVNTGQMQFWFYLFITLLYFSALLFSKIKEKDSQALKFNYFILLMSIFLVLSDRIYFDAVTIGKISVIMPLRRISIIVSVIIGGMIFKEKNLKAKLLCVCVLIIGVALMFVGK